MAPVLPLSCISCNPGYGCETLAAIAGRPDGADCCILLIRKTSLDDVWAEAQD